MTAASAAADDGDAAVDAQLRWCGWRAQLSATRDDGADTFSAMVAGDTAARDGTDRNNAF